MIKALNNNERKITWLEIIAAVIILAILFMGFMTIFPQIIVMNE